MGCVVLVLQTVKLMQMDKSVGKNDKCATTQSFVLFRWITSERNRDRSGRFNPDFEYNGDCSI